MTDTLDIGETERLFLPWHHNDNGLITGTADDPGSEDYPDIADLAQEPGIEGPGDKYRADFIVMACNSHHGMRRMLQCWVEFCDIHKIKDANGNDLPMQLLTKELIEKIKEAAP